ncbi:hypothetical protein GRI94_08580 [Erythrobacter jejuensis]|uniref:Nucleotidyltransferase family protein n=2 Tax=Parerythrobacter jejuensis TaxID=795812 RepID=A0A845AYP3_9SPHN|nr:hypothetical protein [Parerythrobacter jejuensis]
MDHAMHVAAILRNDAFRWHLLGVVAELDLPDCWIAAGFVRNAVWDSLHKRSESPVLGDVDVVWFDRNCSDPARDRAIEHTLHTTEPTIDWSVKNQARMHIRNGDAPYQSATDAMRHWPETATAVAAKRVCSDECEIASPLGLDDLIGLVLRPTIKFTVQKRSIFEERVRSKAWRRKWPMLKCEAS